LSIAYNWCLLNCPDDSKCLQSSFIQGDIWYGTEGDVLDKANVTLHVSDRDDVSGISFCLTISFRQQRTIFAELCDGVVLSGQLCDNKRKIENRPHTKTHKMNDDSAMILKSDVD
jgi:hypothetical protein